METMSKKQTLQGLQEGLVNQVSELEKVVLSLCGWVRQIHLNVYGREATESFYDENIAGKLLKER